MSSELTRRAALLQTSITAAFAAQTPPAQDSYWRITPAMIAEHGDAADRLLKTQVTDPASTWRGGLADAYGLFHGSSASSLIYHYALALALPGSRHRGSSLVLDRLRLAAGFLDRHLSADGNIDLPITNFDSPPDTAFAMANMAAALRQARAAGQRDASALIEPLLERMAGAIAKGGVHTPNHRWVMCEALAQAHSLLPKPAYLRRIDDWLSETIDIDPDGQFSERSTTVYNGIVDRALTVTALRLGRPELFVPVRRNLEALLYLLHPGDEVVTEISRRQDLNQRGSIGNYWLALRALAVRDGNGIYETLARSVHPGLWPLLEFPELSQPGPEPKPVPDRYEREFPESRITRLRRGPVSATLLGGGNSRLFSLRNGGAIITAVRMAGAFFGKGQFVPSRFMRDGKAFLWSQSLEAGYYQPFGDGTRQPVGVDEWYALRGKRRRTEVCQTEYNARLEEVPDGFRLTLSVTGTPGLPVAVEINLDGKDGGLTGAEELPESLAPPQSFLLPAGRFASWRAGSDTIRIGPGRGDHRYTQVRGAEPKLPGRGLFLTMFAPFEHRIEFQWAPGR